MGGEGFEAVDEARWRQAAEAGLKGASFDKLVATTPEGIRIEPLYVERHLAAFSDPGAPASSPFVRGTWTPGSSSMLVAQRFEPGADVKGALARGVDAPWLVVDDAAQLEDLLLGVDLDAVPILLHAQESAPAVCEAARRLGAKHVHPLFDPFAAALARGGLTAILDDAFDAALRMQQPAPRQAATGNLTFAASAACVHEAGGHAGHAIGFALASCMELVRALSRRGLDAGEAFAAVAIIAAPGTDPLRGIALLRALRLGWSKLLAATGVEPRAPTLIATSARRSASRLDVASNLVRESLQTFAALAGGADIVAPLAFDAVLGATPLGVRMAVNTALVLSRESLIGRVSDPAGGSYYVEALTHELARAGWEELRSIEREGGLAASLTAGQFQERVQHANAERRREVATRRRVIVGVNDFCDPHERLSPAPVPPAHPPPSGWSIVKLEPERESAPFEAIRARATALQPRALLLCLGSPADFRARASFARRFLEAGGLDVRVAESSGAAGWIGRACDEYTPRIVVLCSSDDLYASSAAQALVEARQAGARALLLAGRPGALEPALREAGLTHAIHVGVDAVALLSSLLDLAEGA